MKTGSQPRAVLAILSLAAFMASLDLFIVNVAFADIGRDFHGASLSNLSWVLNGYAIVYAALLVPLGRLADRFGRKAGFLLGLGLFIVASGACAVAPTLWLLVVFRLLQAVGAAALTPTSLGLLLPVFAPERRAGAVRIWAATGALAASFGPAIGGVLVTASWRWVFLVNLPIGIVALLAAARWVPDARDESVNTAPDLVGAGVLTIAIGLLSLGLVKISDWSVLDTVAALVGAFVLTAIFWRRSLSHVSPVVEPALLRVRTFAWANVASVLFGIAFAANLLLNVLWMQQVWHYSALRTGIGVVPGPLMVPIFSIVAGRLIARGVPVGRIAAFGCLLVGLGITYVAVVVGGTPAYVTELLPGWLIGGIGVGFALPTMISAATSGLPAARFSTGSGVVNMSRQVGSVLGVSLLVAVMGSPIGYHTTYDAFQRGRIMMIVFCALAAGAALGITPTRTGVPIVPPVLVPPVPVALPLD